MDVPRRRLTKAAQRALTCLASSMDRRCLLRRPRCGPPQSAARRRGQKLRNTCIRSVRGRNGSTAFDGCFRPAPLAFSKKHPLTSARCACVHLNIIRGLSARTPCAHLCNPRLARSNARVSLSHIHFDRTSHPSTFSLRKTLPFSSFPTQLRFFSDRFNSPLTTLCIARYPYLYSQHLHHEITTAASAHVAAPFTRSTSARHIHRSRRI